MRWTKWTLLALLLVNSGCGENLIVVAPGEPLMVVGKVTGRFAHYAGKDANGNRIWNVAAKNETVNLPGYILLPLPAATQPTK